VWRPRRYRMMMNSRCVSVMGIAIVILACSSGRSALHKTVWNIPLGSHRSDARDPLHKTVRNIPLGPHRSDARDPLHKTVWNIPMASFTTRSGRRTPGQRAPAVREAA
jgi:hypothetical protein